RVLPVGSGLNGRGRCDRGMRTTDSGAWPGAGCRIGKLDWLGVLLEDAHAPGLVVRQRVRRVQRACVHPDTSCTHRPTAPDRGGQERAAKPTTEERGQHSEVRDLDIVFD